jgi:integrase
LGFYFNYLTKRIDGEALFASLLDKQFGSYNKSHTNQFLRFLKEHNHGLDGLKPYAESLKDGFVGKDKEHHDYTGKSQETKIGAAKAVGQYVVKRFKDSMSAEERLLWMDLKEEVKPPKYSKAIDEDKYLEWPDVQRLIAETPDKKIGLMIEFLAATNCRIDEMLSAKIDNMKKNGICWRLTICGKGNKFRIVPVDFDLMDDIRTTFGSEKWVFEHNGKQYNKNSVTTRIGTAGQTVLNRKISAHVLRHSWATEERRRKRPIEEISRAMGHSSVSTTMDIYSHVSMKSKDHMLPTRNKEPEGMSLEEEARIGTAKFKKALEEYNEMGERTGLRKQTDDWIKNNGKNDLS